MKTILVSISFLFLAFTWSQSEPWTQKAPIPAEGRHRTTGWSIGNKGYIGLGHYNSGPSGNVAKADIWEYDPSSDTWTQKADYGSGPTYGAVAFTIGNKAYVGAHVYNATEFLEFDPIQNTWTPIASCSGGQSDMTAFAINDKGYFVSSSAIYEYDPLLDTWTLKAYTPISMFSWSKSFTIGEKAFLLGASSGGSLYEYKPSINEFVPRAAYPGEAIGGWSAFGTSTKGYVLTGYINFLNPTSRQTWEFDPDKNEWNQLEELPGSTRRFSSAFVIGEKGYIGTGTNGTNFKDFWEFDPAQAVGIDENSYAVIVNTYPNPSNDLINFQIQDIPTNDLKLNIYDLKGSHVFQQSFVNNSVQVKKEEIGTGIFLYTIQNHNDIMNQGKIIFE